MYKVTSTIIYLPSGHDSEFAGSHDSKKYTLEWYKRDEETEELKGFTVREADDFIKILDAHCQSQVCGNDKSPTTDDEIPYESFHPTPENKLSKFYPFKDFVGEDITGQFSFEIMGYARFLESQ